MLCHLKWLLCTISLKRILGSKSWKGSLSSSSLPPHFTVEENEAHKGELTWQGHSKLVSKLRLEPRRLRVPSRVPSTLLCGLSWVGSSKTIEFQIEGSICLENLKLLFVAIYPQTVLNIQILKRAPIPEHKEMRWKNLQGSALEKQDEPGILSDVD